jgi:hypothetical protein
VDEGKVLYPVQEKLTLKARQDSKSEYPDSSPKLIRQYQVVINVLRHYSSLLLFRPAIPNDIYFFRNVHWQSDKCMLNFLPNTEFCGISTSTTALLMKQHLLISDPDVRSSVRKSGPVRSLAPQGLGPRPRPVHIYFRLEKDRTGLQKTDENRFFAVLRPVLVFCSLNRFKTGLFK